MIQYESEVKFYICFFFNLHLYCFLLVYIKYFLLQRHESSLLSKQEMITHHHRVSFQQHTTLAENVWRKTTKPVVSPQNRFTDVCLLVCFICLRALWLRDWGYTHIHKQTSIPKQKLRIYNFKMASFHHYYIRK